LRNTNKPQQKKGEIKMLSQPDTNWEASKCRNQRRKLAGKVLVVGQRKDKSFWVMVDGDFVNGTIDSDSLAKTAAMDFVLGDDDEFWGSI
jgi:hypothetical protein